MVPVLTKKKGRQGSLGTDVSFESVSRRTGYW